MFEIPDRVDHYASGLDDLKELIEEYPPSRGAEITGCPEKQIIEAARAIGRAKAMLTIWLPAENIQATPGRSILDIIKGLHSGDVRCLWITTTNPAASLPNTSWVKEGLSKAEMLVVQDIFHPTETTMLGDVILAAAQWCEKTGTYTPPVHGFKIPTA